MFYHLLALTPRPLTLGMANAGHGYAFTVHYAFALPNAFTLHPAFAPHNAFGPIITLSVMVRVCRVILHKKNWRFKKLKGYCLNAHPPFPPSTLLH